MFPVLPDRDIVDICTRIHLDQYEEVLDVYKGLAWEINGVVRDVLKFYLNKDEQQRKLVQRAIEETLVYYQEQFELLEQHPSPFQQDEHIGLHGIYLYKTYEQWGPCRAQVMKQYKQQIQRLRLFLIELKSFQV